MASRDLGRWGRAVIPGMRSDGAALAAVALALLIGACGSARDDAPGASISSLNRSSRDDSSSMFDEGEAPYDAPAEELAMAEAVAEGEAFRAQPAGLPADLALVPSAGDGAQQASTSPQEGGAPSTGGVRRIIKDALLGILVEDVPLGIARLETIAAQSGGYVIETATDYRDPARRAATVKMAVPVAGFEAALERIRQAAIEVQSESATGTDVSGEVVDLRAEIANLEATSARVRAFLDQATTVEEALKVNAQLTELEGDIGQRKGRLEYLEQRAAFSTITVTLTEPAPEWTPTATSTPWPTSTPEPWDPGATVRDATGTAGRLGRGLVELVIWLAIVGLPFAVIGAGMLAAILWVLRRVGGRRG